MAALPFLVVHGTVVWIVIVVVGVLAVAAWRLRRKRDVGGAMLWSIAAGGLVALTLYGAGVLVMSRARLTHRTLGGHGYDGPRVAYDLGNLDSLALAAALPGHRGEALEELTGRLAVYYVRTEDVLARWQEVERMRGGCAGELAMLREQERIAPLAERVDACGDDAEAARALVFLGRYADAAKRDPTNIDAVIGAHAWAALVPAVAAFRDGVAHTAPQSPMNAVYPNFAGQLEPRLACAEQFVRLRAGVATKIDADGDPFCKIIAALALPLDQQPAALLAVYPAAPDVQAMQTIEQLAWAAGGPLQPHEHLFDNGLYPYELTQLSPPDHARHIRAALLAPLAAAVRHDPDGSPAARITHTWGAGYLLLRGDLSAAATEARTAVAGDDDLGETAGALVIALSLRGSHKPPDDLPQRSYTAVSIMDPVELARGNARALTASLPLESHDCGFDSAEVQIAVQRKAIEGDGAPLADAIEHCGFRDGLHASELFGLWPQIQHDRQRLAALLAVAAPDFGDPDPFDILRRALLRRDVARLTGDTTSVAAWQALIDRHLAALADRDALTMMIVWHLL